MNQAWYHCPRWLGLGLAFILGAIMPLGFAPFQAWWLVPLLLAGLFGLLHSAATPWRSGWRAAAFGLGYYGFGLSWVHISLHQYGQAPLVFAWFANGLLVIYLSSYLLLMGWLFKRFTRSVGWLIPLWMGMEWCKSHVFSGFPWLNIGYSQTDGLLSGYAPWVGDTGMSLMVLTLACLPFYFRFHRALLVTTGIIALGSLSLLIPWTYPVGKPVPVLLVQGNINQNDKFAQDFWQKSLKAHWRLSLDAPEQALIIWPETALPLFDQSSLGQEIIRVLRRDFPQQQYVVGLFGRDNITQQPTNRALYWSGSQPPVVYDKRHLLPFGEFLPLRGLFNWFHHWVQIPMSDLSPGSPKQALPVVNGHPFSLSICFESAFSEVLRPDLDRAQFLVNLSNDAWFDRSIAAAQHLQIARMRALQWQRPMARATNTGITAFIDHHGQVTQKLPIFVSAALAGTIQPRLGYTLYGYFGDNLTWLLVAFGVFGGLIRSRMGDSKSRPS